MKNRHGFFLLLRIWFRRLWSILIFAVAISNFVLACTASRSLKTTTITSIITNVVDHVTVVTQILSSVSVPVSPDIPIDDSLNYFQPVDHPTHYYRYMLINGVKAVQLFGRLHYVGSRTSYGRIIDIYPDRLLLDSGDTISNSNLKGTDNGSRPIPAVAGGVGRD